MSAKSTRSSGPRGSKDRALARSGWEWLSFLDRVGGYLIAPRKTLARLEAGEGARDALVLGLLYVLGTSIYPLAEATAGAWAVRNLGGALTVLSALGRALIVPIIATVVIDTVLGRARAHRNAIGLVPLVVLGVGAHALRQSGVDLPGPAYLPDVVGAGLGVALAAWSRSAIAAVEDR